MNYRNTLMLITLFFMQTSVINAQRLPSKKDVLAKMVLTNAYFMNKWPDPGTVIVTDKTRPSHIWTRAVYYEGLMALYRTNPDKTYYDSDVSIRPIFAKLLRRPWRIHYSGTGRMAILSTGVVLK